MAGFEGKWAIEVATLAGSRRYDLTLSTVGAALTGTAVGAAGPVPIRDGTVTDDRAQFVLELAAPLPTSLVFQLQVVGDRITGTARAGLFPPSSVLGTRVV